MGFMFSAFSWAYAAATLPGGYFLDRFGTRKTYGACLGGWSLLTMLHAGFASIGPYLAAAMGVMFGGAWGDWMIKRGMSVNFARQWALGFGAIVAMIGVFSYTVILGKIERLHID